MCENAREKPQDSQIHSHFQNWKSWGVIDLWIKVSQIYNFFKKLYKSIFLKGNLQFLKKLLQRYVSRFSIKGDLAVEIVIYMTKNCFVNLTPNLLK